jgi:hypothetical protein
MNQLERVARAICRVNGFDPDEPSITGKGPLWRLYISDAQAAIDAMQQDIKAADRQARKECEDIAIGIASHNGTALEVADAIRETM